MEKEKKYLFITGATSGFGLACARLFAAEGWDLILTGRRKGRLQQLQLELTGQYPELDVQTLCFDVRDQKEVAANIQSLDKTVLQQIRILLNNAGLALGRSPIDAGDLSDWEQMIDTNVKGLLYVSREIIPYLKANKKGHIINLGSIAGKEVYPEGNVYCASKFAVDALTKAMRIDLLPYSIKVSQIAPGAANTEFSSVRFKGDEQTAQSVYKGFEPLVAQDVAEVILFMATRPAHVNINDLVITPTAQASTMHFFKQDL